MVTVRGRFVNGSTLVYKKENNSLIPGLLFEDGTYKWFNYRWVNGFHNDLSVADNGKYMGYINRKGEEFIPFKYIAAEDFSEGLAFANDGTSTYLIDVKGNVIREWPEAFVTSGFNNGTALLGRMSDEGEEIEEALINAKGEFLAEFAPKKKIRDIGDIYVEPAKTEWHEGIKKIYNGSVLTVTDECENTLSVNFYL